MSTEKRKVCGIDVHKAFLVATILDREGNCETRRIQPNTESLLEFRNWIQGENCESVAFESTADYWRSLYLVLEGRVPVTVANAHHIKHVPGRKTDITDSRWIAQLELNGLITPSRIFAGEMYDLRSLTRSRELLVQNRTELKNKIHHLLDSASIRLSSVLSDLFGKSGSIILKGLIQNNPFEKIVESLPKKCGVAQTQFLQHYLLQFPRSFLFFSNRTSSLWMILISRSNFLKEESGKL